MQKHGCRPEKARLLVRSLLHVTTAALIVGSLLAPPSASAQSPKTLKFGYILSPNSQLGAGGAVSGVRAA